MPVVGCRQEGSKQARNLCTAKVAEVNQGALGMCALGLKS